MAGSVGLHTIFIWGWREGNRLGPALTPLEVFLSWDSWAETGGTCQAYLLETNAHLAVQASGKRGSLGLSEFGFSWPILHYELEIWGSFESIRVTHLVHLRVNPQIRGSGSSILLWGEQARRPTGRG